MLFEPQGIGKTIFTSRYAFHPEETYEGASNRVASCIAAGETDYKRYHQEFFDILSQGLFSPGGRIMRSAGRAVPAMINCFTNLAEDSREGWAKMVGDNIVIAGTGGGLGTNYSPIRHRGAEIRGTGGFATGAVSIMRIENAALTEIKDGGGRRAARMMCLNIDHPDIEEFLHAKLDLKELTNANISVWFNTDPELFFEKVRNDLPHDLIFQGKVVKSVSARNLWSKIVSHSLMNGEPGVLNGYLANDVMSNISYTGKVVCTTNPCGEIPMQPYSTCCLGALVLPAFIKPGKESSSFNTRIDWEKLHHVVTTSVRFLDDVLSVTYYPTEEIKKESALTRRIGLGIMGLHYMLINLGVKYSSPEALEVCDKVGAFVKHAAYDASTALSIEKGPFTLWDREKAPNCGFIKYLKPSIKNKIKAYGLRNCALLTSAPTGTTSMVMGVSSGVEPIFAPAYRRRYFQGDVLQQEVVVDPLFKEYVLNGGNTELFESAADLSPEQHLDMQVVWQKHICNAVSKTINIPFKKYSEEMLSDLYMKYLPKLKGITVYPEGTRPDEPLERMSLEEAVALIKAGEGSEEISDDCSSGTCGL